MNLFDSTDFASLDHGRASAERARRGTLVAHLGDQVIITGDVAHHASFVDGVSHWLLAEAMLAHPHGHQSRRTMSMIRRADRHCIDALAHFIEHLAEIIVCPGTGELVLGTTERVVVDIADRDDVPIRFCITGVTGAFTTDTDTAKADFVDRGSAGFGRDSTGGPKASASGSRRLHEITSVRSVCHTKSSFGKIEAWGRTFIGNERG